MQEQHTHTPPIPQWLRCPPFHRRAHGLGVVRLLLNKTTLKKKKELHPGPYTAVFPERVGVSRRSGRAWRAACCPIVVVIGRHSLGETHPGTRSGYARASCVLSAVWACASRTLTASPTAQPRCKPLGTALPLCKETASSWRGLAFRRFLILRCGSVACQRAAAPCEAQLCTE